MLVEAFRRIADLKTSRGWTMLNVREPDDGVFGVETANEELLVVEPAKELQRRSLVGLP